MAKKAKKPAKKPLKTKGKKMARNPNPKLDEEPKEAAAAEDYPGQEARPAKAEKAEKPIAPSEPYPTGGAEPDHDAEFFAAHGFHREGSKAAEAEKAAQEKAARAAEAAAAKEEDK
jgi:hypothetical protein